jgi:diaminohydroxyphosphoribosylaminopyrimidine deaminase / 5-amino-6-(5-phosphoribosylamino)uracil reductase
MRAPGHRAFACPPPPRDPGVQGRVRVDAEHGYMRRALELAERGWGRTSPNPMVGAVVVSEDGDVWEGWHEGPGEPHAEIMALSAAGDRARDATIFCTLEPCDHTGRTGPCTQALIEAGISRVVFARRDPNPVVSGRGLTTLRDGGVDVVAGPYELEARRLNEAYERHVVSGLPFVILKMAASLDGKTATSAGESQWITGEPARADVQRLRAWSDAIVVGANTVLADDPALTVRDHSYSAARPPLRVIVDANGRVPPSARVFDDAAPTLVATTETAPRDRLAEWARAGADVAVLGADRGLVSLAELVEALGKHDVQGMLVEGGAALAASFVAQDLVDKIVLYMAPILIGGSEAPGVLTGEGFAAIEDARRLEPLSLEMVGSDLRVEAYVHRDR